MPDEQPDEPPAGDGAAGAAFAGFAAPPARGRPAGRTRPRLVAAVAVVVAVGLAAAYLARPTRHHDPDAPRVVVEVIGMHCPVQCGLRVTAALERLPFVVPGSVTANPTDGVVTFVPTSPEAVDPDRVRAAIEKAGFDVRSVTPPGTAPDRRGHTPPD